MAHDTTTSPWSSRGSADRRRVPAAVAAAALLSVAALGAAAPSVETPAPAGDYRIQSEETHRGDLYVLRDKTLVDGTQEGDLYLVGNRLEVSGSVTGDVTALVRSADLTGTFGDTVRVWSFGDLRFDGIVDGDLFAFGEHVTLGPLARVTGALHAGGSRVEILGTVQDDLEVTGGEIVLGALVGGSARIRSDRLRIEPGAAIAGDLAYEAKAPVPAEDLGVVRGEVSYGQRQLDVERRRALRGELLRRGAFFLASVLAGALLIAAFRRFAERASSTVGDAFFSSAGMGFITFLAVPAACFLAAILIVGIPVALIAAAGWATGIYLAKVPFATWLGRRVLGVFGRRGPSPYLALTLGLAVLHIGFALPWVGLAIWVASTLVGLGAMILALRSTRGSEEAA